VVAFSGRNIFRKAIKQIGQRAAGMDTLIAVGTGSAFFISIIVTLFPRLVENTLLNGLVYFETAAVVITLVLTGKYLEERAKKSSTRAMNSLLLDQPKEVEIIRDGFTTSMSSMDITSGDLVIIKAGQSFPIDGIIHEGTAFIDESSMTGEPILISKSEGDKVISGTINTDGRLIIRADKVGADTVLNRIIELVEKAQSNKAPIELLADRISRYFVPIVIAIALLTGISWFLVGGEQRLILALTTSISVLVISCPCALGLATPTAMTVALGRAASNGILVKDGGQLQQASSVHHLVFDKTGTLTKGRPVVKNVKWFVEEKKQKQFAALLYCMEDFSSHPLAEAVIQHFNYIDETDKNIDLESFQEIAGSGSIAKYLGKEYRLGHPRLMKPELFNSIQESKESGTYLSDDEKLICELTFEDEVKDKSAGLISDLKELGIELHILSGDQQRNVTELANSLGVNTAKGDLLPNQKLDYLKSLKASGKLVAMVGDGINDGPALAEADVSIALGDGSDLALEYAGISLLGGKIEKT